MYLLAEELLSFIIPSLSYPVFLNEQLTLFKLKAIKEGRPYKFISASEFLEKIPLVIS
jgi:hypothetical protein